MRCLPVLCWIVFYRLIGSKYSHLYICFFIPAILAEQKRVLVGWRQKSAHRRRGCGCSLILLLLSIGRLMLSSDEYLGSMVMLILILRYMLLVDARGGQRTSRLHISSTRNIVIGF